jgi:hypothetical protein
VIGWLPVCLSFRSGAQESGFMFSSTMSQKLSSLAQRRTCTYICFFLCFAVVQVLAVILSAAKDPDKSNAPLPLESFNQQVFSAALAFFSPKNTLDSVQGNRSGNLLAQYSKRHLLFNYSEPVEQPPLDKTAGPIAGQ